MKLITRESLKSDMEANFQSGKKVFVAPDETARVVPVIFGSGRNLKDMGQGEAFRLMNSTHPLSMQGDITVTGNYRSGFDVPMNGKGSVREMVTAGKFVGNTLNENWQQFIDALRIDLTIRKVVNQTIRQNIYKVVSLPNADRIITLQEMFPYAFEFLENNGEGQSVPMGETMSGQKDYTTFFIKATGFVYTLLASMFDKTLDFTKVTDGVADAYALQRDEDAIKPILDYAYGAAETTKHTGADATGANPQEKLYITMLTAIADLGLRPDPMFADLKIVPDGLVLLCSSQDAYNIQSVIAGLPSGNASRVYRAITQIDKIVTYDSSYTLFSNRTKTYTGVTPGIAYLIKPNRYMMIGVKRDLTMEMDATPNVLTLARTEKAWYYSETIYNAGISSFIQKITLPAWY